MREFNKSSLFDSIKKQADIDEYNNAYELGYKDGCNSVIKLMIEKAREEQEKEDKK